MYQILGNDFTATIQAIAAAGKSQVLSRPSILARDGQLAKIVVGQDIYLPSGVSYNTVGVTTTPIINGTYTEVGIILDVTPFIGANGLVEMIVQPQTSAVDTSSPGQVIATGGILGSPVYAPNINIRSADTVVVTPERPDRRHRRFDLQQQKFRRQQSAVSRRHSAARPVVPRQQQSRSRGPSC